LYKNLGFVIGFLEIRNGFMDVVADAERNPEL
jgi:hypothetical protein